MRMKSCFLVTCVLMAVSPAAIAQAPPAPATPPTQTAPPPAQPSSECAPTPGNPSQGKAAPGTTTGMASEPLGDKLARSNGVLCPPSGVDPEMRAPTPDVGKTPVIPPPGSPGGDPNVRPK